MKLQPPMLNLFAAWIGVLFGFVSGALLGMKFHRADWLGGYASYPRRMLRLGHISFFGLAVINVMFYSAAGLFAAMTGTLLVASWAFVIGAITMPVACALMATSPRWWNAFVIPVASLLTGAVLTLWELWHLL